MAVRIRLARAGAKKNPYYHVIAAESTSRRDGKYIEAFGSYDPTVKPAKVQFDDARLDYWLKAGALPTDTVGELIKRYKKAQTAAKA